MDGVEHYFRRLCCVQYDPLKPAGRNVDLVFQSRIAGYRVDDWESLVYGASPRRYYDAWDKQACLVPVTDWPYRRHYHTYFHEIWKPRVFDPYPEAVARVEAALEERGPSSAAALADIDLPGSDDGKREGSWFGPRLMNHVLKALWYTGRIVTHARESGRHVYAPAAAVVPDDLLAAPPMGEAETLEWLVLRRHRTAGLLRPCAGKAVFSLPAENAPIGELIGTLADQGALVRLDVEGMVFHALRDLVEEWENAFHSDRAPGRVRFLAPLDALLWDRRAVLHIYDFDYVWEVYKPAERRRHGYYVLPVMHGTDLVGRVEFTWRAPGILSAQAWWEEKDATRLAATDFVAELGTALGRFRDYAGAGTVTCDGDEVLTAATGFAGT